MYAWTKQSYQLLKGLCIELYSQYKNGMQKCPIDILQVSKSVYL